MGKKIKVKSFSRQRGRKMVLALTPPGVITFPSHMRSNRTEMIKWFCDLRCKGRKCTLVQNLIDTSTQS